MPSFVTAFSQLSLNLARLLDVAFVPGEGAHSGHTGAALARVIEFHNSGDHDHRDWEFTRLQLLVDDLQLVEAHRPDLFAVFRRKLQNPDPHSYFGSRHELGIAVALIERDIDFEFEVPGRADFQVSSDGGTVGIECGSSHLSKMREGDLSYKIGSVLREKAGKSYAGADCALFVDATNLQGISLRAGRLLFGSESDDPIRDDLAKTPFGSFVLMATVINKDLDPPWIQRTCSRLDNPWLAPQLAPVLDQLCPDGNAVEMRDYSFPPAP